MGKQENVKRIVDALQEMQYTMKEIARQLESGDFPLSDDGYRKMKEGYLAIAITVVENLEESAEGG